MESAPEWVTALFVCGGGLWQTILYPHKETRLCRSVGRHRHALGFFPILFIFSLSVHPEDLSRTADFPAFRAHTILYLFCNYCYLLRIY